MEKRIYSRRRAYLILLVGMLLSLLGLSLVSGTSQAAVNMKSADQIAALQQPEDTPIPTEQPKDCSECHLDKYDAWFDSPHAHAFDNEAFQDGWRNMEYSSDCLLCHKAQYDAETNTYMAEGVYCETCHGQANPEHPPAEIPLLSDEEYCGTCHPAILGEVRISGHTSANEVRCVDCHDPHNQQQLYENPNDLCMSCHEEDLGKMDERLSGIHLQEEISCVTCHTLDIPHTFLFNFEHEDTTQFLSGANCTSEITTSISNRVGTTHEMPGNYLQDQMTWPIVHRVSQHESALQCSDCHVMDEEMRTNFIALGYTPEEVDQFLWEKSDFPSLTEADLNKLVATPKMNRNWVYWLAGILVIFGVFEVSVTRNLERSSAPKEHLSFFRKFRWESAQEKKKTTGNQPNEEQKDE